MDIIRFGGQSLRNEEYFRHKTETLEAINNSAANVTPIKPILDPFIASVDDVDEALEIIRKSSLTDKIQEEDRERDVTTTGFSNTVTGLTKHFKPEIRKQANELQIIFRHYKGINQQSVVSQTGSTINLLQALREKQYALTTLGLNEWATQLEIINNKVAMSTMDRFDENAAKPLQRMKEVRPVCDELLNKLYAAIETFAKITPSAEFEKCINTLNSINKKYIDTIAQRRGIAEAKKESGN